ncbi:tetratricopeptide repeat protein [Lachnoanaerobaculum saburreum]|uniref:Tetratricopeptide repeat protein n=1 Tax=Lachnoanaerobaculum saburreum TaxID=467210 RepID=A0A133ZTD5_9FIRM|nr:tetratricopeptide repeat protein [Lachnoanaerobaculum saburreum]KXB58690.1 tetratricopeptide repeat protein [Lachnoanaerobaculum saburreum]
MDKYEFNLKVEQLNKLVKSGDYKAAMRITDTIDWRRVHKADLLATVSEVYEKNNEYKEAREILLLSYDRAPVGKRVLYKLAMLAIKEGDISEAQEYYKEYTEISPQDSRKYLMEYHIANAKGEGIDKKIRILEKYNDIEKMDEEWKFELAQLYAKAGRIEDCIKTCDEIMLLFSVGEYVDKAAALKASTGCPLSSKQLDMVENKEYYEERLNTLAEKYESGDRENYPSLNLDDMSAYTPRENKKTTISLGNEKADVSDSAPISTELFPRNTGVNETRISETTFKGESVNPEFELELKRSIAIAKANLDEMSRNKNASSMEEIDEEVRARMEKVERVKHSRFVTPPVMAERRKSRISNHFDSMGLPKTHISRAEHEDMEIEPNILISDEAESRAMDEPINELVAEKIYPNVNDSMERAEVEYEDDFEDVPTLSGIEQKNEALNEEIKDIPESNEAGIKEDSTEDDSDKKEPQQNITVTQTASTKVLENYVPEKKAPIFDNDDLINSYFDEEVETGVPTVSGVIAQRKEQKDVVQSSVKSESKMEVIDDEEVYYTKEERTFVTKVKKGETPSEIVIEPEITEIVEEPKTVTVEETDDNIVDEGSNDVETQDIETHNEPTDKPVAKIEGIKPLAESEPKEVKRVIKENIAEPKEPKEDETVVIEESVEEVPDENETDLSVHGKVMKARAPKQREPKEFLMRRPGSIVVEGITAQKALENAIEVLKEVNTLTKIKRSVLKIGALSLNSRGVKNSYEKIKGKDLIIVEAGELDDKTIAELIDFIKDGKETVVFSDTIEGIESLLASNDLLYGMSLVLREEEVPVKKKNIVANIVIKERESEKPKDTTEEIVDTNTEVEESKESEPAKKSDFDNVEEILRKIYGDDSLKFEISELKESESIKLYNPSSSVEQEDNNADEDDRDIADEAQSDNVVFENAHDLEYITSNSVKEKAPDTDADEKEIDYDAVPEVQIITPDNRPMALNEFILYAADYIKEIECVLEGKAMEAIEERADYMLEDGTPLNKKNARSLIDHAADMAEKAGIFKSIFKPKYDKEGRLILREEHFKI